MRVEGGAREVKHVKSQHAASNCYVMLPHLPSSLIYLSPLHVCVLSVKGKFRDIG